MGIQTETGVDARVDGKRHLAPGVFDGNETCGNGETLQQNVVLYVEAEVRAVQSVVVVSVWFVQRFTQVAAHDVLVAELGSEGRAACKPVEIAVQLDAEDIRAVVVKGCRRLLSANQFEAVVAAVPVNGRLKVQPSFRLSRQGDKQLGSLLVLFVKPDAIERVGAEAFGRQSRMPV